MNWLARLIVDSATKEYSRAAKGLFTLWGFIVFQLIVPGSAILLGVAADRLFGFWFDVHMIGRWGVFFPFLVIGQTFIIWTAVHQLRYSGGTPAFKAPPKRLLVAGPYRYCRNPMIFGYLAFYYGAAILLASPAALLGFCPALHLFALYVIVHVEEVELERRFGRAYLDYKSRVNRLLPSPPSWRQRDRRRSAPAER